MESNQPYRPENTTALPPSPESEGARPTFQMALERTRPRWQVAVLAFCGITLSFVVPGIALCGVLSASGIVGSIAGTTLVCGICYWVASRVLERKSGDDPRVLDLQLSSVLVIAAGLLWFGIAMQAGPVGGRLPGLWSTLAIAGVAMFTNAVLMLRHAARVA